MNTESRSEKMTPLATVDWHAPEIESGIYDISVDIFSFGVLFLEIISWESQLPEGWRDKLSSLHKSAGSSPVLDIIFRCISCATERPTAEQMVDALLALHASDLEAFGLKWDSC